MVRTVLFAGLLACLLGACQPGPSSSPASTAATTPAATPGPVVSPAPSGAGATEPAGSPIATRVTAEIGAEPFLLPADGPEGSVYAMPAAGTRAADGTVVLVIVWFGAGTEPPTITVSTSDDGATWDVGQDHILEGLEIGFDDPGPIPSAIVQLEDGSWQLYGWASANATGSAFLTWRTSAPSLDGPWVLDGDALLDAGPALDWDSFLAGAGSVLRTDDGFAMWFEGEPPGSSVRGDIGLATSADGLTWTKHDDPATTAAPFAASDPVLPAGTCGAATSAAVEQPQVERVGERYVALFGGFGPGGGMMDVFGAVSDDGRTWQCGTPEPILRSSALGAGEGLHTIATVPLADGGIGLIAESIVTDHSELWWATVTLAAE
jgi:hypothetical protein